ncbi:MAG: FtsX-like permease family protein [Pseudomonadales bacterium]
MRDLWHLRAQVLAIALVIGSGVAVLVMALSTLTALERTTDAYYERYRFADVFATVTRAPNRLARRIRQIEGVHTVETRIAHQATLDIAGFNEPAMGMFVSIPEDRQPLLNQIVLRSGRWIRLDRPDEVLINEPFAEAHNLKPGDRLVAILNGYRRELDIVGVALSPEFIYSLGPGFLMPDDKRYGVLWMGHSALASAFDLEGAFNDVALALSREARTEAVIQQLDRLLERFGSTGSIARKNQLSNWFVSNEMEQIATMSRILPVIFLVIAAFLTHMLLGRLLATERSQIGLLKAFGYNQWEVGLHYAKVVLGIAITGLVIGYGLGAWFGRINTEQYANLFRFPLLLYRPSTSAFAIAAMASMTAALLGAGFAVRQAIALAPAEAMQPPSPPTFKRSRLAATALGRWLDQPTRIILRNITRWPGRSLLTSIGVSAAVALMVLSLQWNDALHYLAQSYFFDAQRQHLTLGMNEPQSPTVLREIEHLPGVLAVEPTRIVGAELSSGSVTHRGAVTGVAAEATLQPIYDDSRHASVAPPRKGLVLGTYLANKLAVDVGDPVWVKILSGRRPERQLPVADIIETYIAMPAYLHIDTLDRMMQDGPRIEYANLLIDSTQASTLFARLKEIPAVSAVMLRRAAINSFYDTVIEHMMVIITMFSALAGIMGFGVAYNSARITLSERGRELATLRVLGFSRAEISYILLGEVGLLVTVALPVGCLLGYELATLIATTFDTELFRIPVNIEPSTYAVAVLVILAATLLSAAIVNLRINRLDLIQVLKSRE